VATAEVVPTPVDGRVEPHRTAVLHVGGLLFASEKAIVERVLAHRPGVLEVVANPVAQTATVTFDPGRTSVAELRWWVEECGYHCAGGAFSPTFHAAGPLATGLGWASALTLIVGWVLRRAVGPRSRDAHTD